MTEMWDKITREALTRRGVKLLSGKHVKELFRHLDNKPYKLLRSEAKRIEPEWDRDMPEYSMYGELPKSGNGHAADHLDMVRKFYELDDLAQKNETFAMRYDVCLAKY